MNEIEKIEFQLNEKELKHLRKQKKKLKVSYYKMAMKEYTPAYWCYIFHGKVAINTRALKRLLNLGFKFVFTGEGEKLMQPTFIIDTKSNENYFVVIGANNERLLVSKLANTLEAIIAYFGKDNIKEII